ncbi:hypothetical protein HOE67_02940 [Candidatus Peregrinibacteria bacterium]|nr:hypothetical protein [Candidatus Peregrinibacteria bacterium]MBT4056043.1 hypothetical protein [Candidatus Peregrinibacteria bacterium]
MEKAEQLVAKIDETDQLNELANGEEMNVSVEYEEQIAAKTQNISQTLGAYLGDPVANDAKKVFEDHLEGILERAASKLKDNELQDDVALQGLVEVTLDELDGLLESITDEEAAPERLKFVTEFLDKNPEFKELKINLNDTSTFVMGGENYHWAEILKRFESHYEKKETTTENKKKQVTKLNEIAGAIGTKSAMKIVASNEERSFEDWQGMSYTCKSLKKHFKKDELTTIANSIRSNPIPVLSCLAVAVNQGLQIKDPRSFVRKLDYVAEKNKYSLRVHQHDLLSAATTEAQFLHLVELGVPDRKSGKDLAFFIREKHVNIMELTPEIYDKLCSFQVLRYINLTHMSDNDAQKLMKVASDYEVLFDNFKLEEILKAKEALGYSDFSSFLDFLVDCHGLLPGSDIVEIAKKYKKTTEYFTDGLHEIYFSTASTWDEAFKILQILHDVEYYDIESIKLLMPRIASMDDETIVSKKGLYMEIAERIKFQHSYRSGFEDEIEAELKLAAEKLIDCKKLSNSRRNRHFLESLSPIFLGAFDEGRKRLGYSTEIVPDKELPIKDFKIGKEELTDKSSKIADRSPAYLAKRALAYFSEIDNVDTSKFEKRIEEKNGLKYEKYFDDGDEVFVSITAPGKGIGINYSKTGKREDSPMNKIPNVLLEVTAGMVKKDKKTPTDLMAVNGEAINPNLHPSHDGVIIIGAQGNTSIQHIESISKKTLGGGEGTINGRGEGIGAFAEAVQYNKLSVMQGPMVINNGKAMKMSLRGTPWYKRAFVQFNNGQFGFVESSKPIDNLKFFEFLKELKLQNAILLDTGNYDNYRDVNGKEKKAREYNPIMLYIK